MGKKRGVKYFCEKSGYRSRVEEHSLRKKEVRMLKEGKGGEEIC